MLFCFATFTQHLFLSLSLCLSLSASVPNITTPHHHHYTAKRSSLVKTLLTGGSSAHVQPLVHPNPYLYSTNPSHLSVSQRRSTRRTNTRWTEKNECRLRNAFQLQTEKERVCVLNNAMQFKSYTKSNSKHDKLKTMLRSSKKNPPKKKRSHVVDNVIPQHEMNFPFTF